MQDQPQPNEYYNGQKVEFFSKKYGEQWVDATIISSSKDEDGEVTLTVKFSGPSGELIREDVTGEDDIADRIKRKDDYGEFRNQPRYPPVKQPGMHDYCNDRSPGNPAVEDTDRSQNDRQGRL